MIASVERLVALLALLSGCDYVFRLDKVSSDRGSVDGSDAQAFGRWSAPQPMAELNSVENDSDPSMTDDGLEVYFASNRDGSFKLYRATRLSIAAPFSAPAVVPELASVATFGQITGDGLTFYAGLGDIRSATRMTRPGVFGTPVVDAALSSSSADRNPGVSSDRQHANISRGDTLGVNDMFEYARPAAMDAWSEARAMTELNSAGDDSSAWVASGGLAMAFHSDRTRLDGKADLFWATRPSLNDPFTFEEILELSTEVADEREPFVSADQLTIIFIRSNDLYISTRAPL